MWALDIDDRERGGEWGNRKEGREASMYCDGGSSCSNVTDRAHLVWAIKGTMDVAELIDHITGSNGKRHRSWVESEGLGRSGAGRESVGGQNEENYLQIIYPSTGR